jgi:DDE family transposase
MINDFNDFCLWVYFVVDEIWLKIAPFFKRLGPPPDCPNSELLAMALNGIILDFELVPANEFDLEVGFELLSAHTGLQVLGDEAYSSVAKAAHLWQENRIQLRTIPRRNQRKQLSLFLQQLYNSIRQMVETINAQLSNQFNIEVNHMHTLWGLCTRLYTKLAAHTLCIYINRVLGKPDFLQIKSLAFPI